MLASLGSRGLTGKVQSGKTGVDVCETDGHHFLHSLFPRDLGVPYVFGVHVL